jgi:hypothetical protein
MRKRLVILSLVVASVLGFQAVADEPLKETTEFGITITPDDLSDAIQETQDFWEPVRLYLASEEFDGPTDAAMRKEVVAFFTSIHEGFYQKLFEGDDSNVEDLVDYLGLRLRKFVIYRRLREAIGDDTALAQLVERWERAHRDINALGTEERAPRVAAVLELMRDEMKSLGMSETVTAQATELWDMQSQCLERMAGTETGVMMIGFEHKARQMDRPTGEMIRLIATASDWTLIVKKEKGSAGLAEFKAAWRDLAEMRAKRLTMAKPAARQ